MIVCGVCVSGSRQHANMMCAPNRSYSSSCCGPCCCCFGCCADVLAVCFGRTELVLWFGCRRKYADMSSTPKYRYAHLPMNPYVSRVLQLTAVAHGASVVQISASTLHCMSPSSLGSRHCHDCSQRRQCSPQVAHIFLKPAAYAAHCRPTVSDHPCVC